MFTDEQEAQGFEQYQAMMERQFAANERAAAQEMIKQGCRAAHWPSVAAGYEILAQSTNANEAATCAKEFARYRRMANAGHFAAAQDELRARALRRMA